MSNLNPKIPKIFSQSKNISIFQPQHLTISIKKYASKIFQNYPKWIREKVKSITLLVKKLTKQKSIEKVFQKSFKQNV